MTDEEMQKVMKFIVGQEMKSSAKIDALADAQQGADARLTRSEEGISVLLSIAEIYERDIEPLGEKIAAVSENGRATDERLNARLFTSWSAR